MEAVVDVGVRPDEGADQIADHGGRTAAVVAQVDDDGVGAGNQLKRGVDLLASRIIGPVEVGEDPHVDQADIAGQDLDRAEALAVTDDIVGEGHGGEA
ncbi:hypothetical protein D3C80_1277980 [compost metagenome]